MQKKSIQKYLALKNQKGFLMPLTIFILVAMSMFAMVLSRNTIQTSTSSVLELVQAQAFYAAESGGFRGLQTLFFPDASSRNAVDTRCAAMNSTYTFTVTGLNNCAAVVTCSCLYADNTACSASTAANYSSSAATAKVTSFYVVQSVATCGNGNIRSVRTIQSNSMMKQE